MAVLVIGIIRREGKMKTFKFVLLVVACMLLVPVTAMATGGGGGHSHSSSCGHGGGSGGGGCNGGCGAKIKVEACFDENQNGRCSSSEGPMDGLIFLYNESWESLAPNLLGRDDGILLNPEDRGETTFLGLRPDNYILCMSGYEGSFTYPTAGTPDPSSRISVTERPSVQVMESRYCFLVELRNACSDEEIKFAYYSEAE
jgi:hypothetical protein